MQLEPFGVSRSVPVPGYGPSWLYSDAAFKDGAGGSEICCKYEWFTQAQLTKVLTVMAGIRLPVSTDRLRLSMGGVCHPTKTDPFNIRKQCIVCTVSSSLSKECSALPVSVWSSNSWHRVPNKCDLTRPARCPVILLYLLPSSDIGSLTMEHNCQSQLYQL